jgi:hypothetical protein
MWSKPSLRYNQWLLIYIYFVISFPRVYMFLLDTPVCVSFMWQLIGDNLSDTSVSTSIV